jgi:hypothetical protein
MSAPYPAVARASGGRAAVKSGSLAHDQSGEVLCVFPNCFLFLRTIARSGRRRAARYRDLPLPRPPATDRPRLRGAGQIFCSLQSLRRRHRICSGRGSGRQAQIQVLSSVRHNLIPHRRRPRCVGERRCGGVCRSELSAAARFRRRKFPCTTAAGTAGCRRRRACESSTRPPPLDRGAPRRSDLARALAGGDGGKTGRAGFGCCRIRRFGRQDWGEASRGHTRTHT